MKIEDINLVTKKCNAQDINVATKPDEEFFDAQETLALQSSLPLELLVNGEVSHTWILDSRASLCMTPHKEWFMIYDLGCRG